MSEGFLENKLSSWWKMPNEKKKKLIADCLHQIHTNQPYDIV